MDRLGYAEAIHEELEDRDYYTQKSVFWVPALARWKTLEDSARLPPGTEIEVTDGDNPAKGSPATAGYKITSTGRLIDDALQAIERENPNAGREAGLGSRKGGRRPCRGKTLCWPIRSRPASLPRRMGVW